MGKRINQFINKLPQPTKGQAQTEVARAEVEGEDATPLRKVLPGEEPKADDFKCQGKTWPVDDIKKGAIQMCPQENLQYIRYNIGYDMVSRYCPRCAEHAMAHPEDIYFQKLNIPPETPKTGWRPDPMPKGWKP